MPSPLINVMSGAAIKAGKSLLRDFGEVDQLHVSRKGKANFVTAADTRTEKLLQRELAKARPAWGFLLEEGGEVPGTDPAYRWIIDPLDGTTNFIHAVPYFCIAIGLEKRTHERSEIVAGVIFDPIHNELFTAEAGKGAFLNERRITVSARDSLEDAMLVTSSAYFAGNRQLPSSVLDTCTRAGAILRCFGATALDLAHLAAGRFDACWYPITQPWDIAAGMLMVREAGGLVTDMTGRPAGITSPALLCSNQRVHPAVSALFAPEAAAS